MNRGVGSSRWLICLGLDRVFAIAFVLTLGFGCTAPNPDYPQPPNCVLGERQCASNGSVDRPIARVCGRDFDDTLLFIDEMCPLKTRCDDGRCAPTADLVACTRQSDCPADKSCVPLVSGSALAGFCVPHQPAAAAAPGGVCADDRNCQSYHCLQQAQGKNCLLTCGSDNHCPLATPRCQALNVTISGVQGMVGSCSPR